jgi:hypothetical protein
MCPRTRMCPWTLLAGVENQRAAVVFDVPGEAERPVFLLLRPTAPRIVSHLPGLAPRSRPPAGIRLLAAWLLV